MSTQLRLLGALGAAAGAALMFAPAAAAAPYGCESGDCTLVASGDPDALHYLGWRPFVTDWWGNQSVDVQDADGETLYTYPVGVMGFQSPFFDASAYHYHTPDEIGGGSAADVAGAASSEDDPYGLSGVTLYDVGFVPALAGSDAATDAAGNPVLLDTLTAFDPEDMAYYFVLTGPGGLQNTLEVDFPDFSGVFSDLTGVISGDLDPIELLDDLPSVLGGSSDYLTLPGQDDPMMLWDTLGLLDFDGQPDLGPVDVSDLVPPEGIINLP